MPKRRANGEGNIRKRKDGRWEGRYTVGHDPETGKAIIKNVLGKTQAEVKEKLKKAIEENVGIDYGRSKTYTVYKRENHTSHIFKEVSSHEGPYAQRQLQP